MDTTSNDRDNDPGRRFQPKLTPPRDDFFMGLLLIAASGCRDPFGQQAAFVVDKQDRLISHGINFVELPEHAQAAVKKAAWEPENRDLVMSTAAESAVDRALKYYSPGATADPFHSHTLYTTYPPTLRCIRRACTNGLKDIIYGPCRSMDFNDPDWQAAKKAAEFYHARLKPFEGNLNWLRDKVASLAHLF